MPWIVFPNIHFEWTRLQLDVRLSHFLLQRQPTISLQSKIEKKSSGATRRWKSWGLGTLAARSVSRLVDCQHVDVGFPKDMATATPLTDW